MALEEVRRRFADELAGAVGLRTPRLGDAFARVPREDFLGPGPWLQFTPEGYHTLPGTEPAILYSDRALALDVSRLINNASPFLLARMIDELDLGEGGRVAQVGCGAGYYTAILAELVGPSGRVLALELEPGLAERARRNLRRLRQVEVRHADGRDLAGERVDAVLVCAGVTHAQPSWLDALAPGGRLVFPLTGVRIPGGVTARVVRDHAGQVLRVEKGPGDCPARFVDRVAIPALFGGRDRELQRRIARAFEGGGARHVRSLRRGEHAHDGTCWLRGHDFCLSTREPGG